MIESIDRKLLFAQYPFIDTFVALMQQAYASDFDTTDNSHVKVLKRYYDHQLSFNNTMKGTDLTGVFAVVADNKPDYRQQMPVKFASFMKAISAGKICLLDFLDTALFEFRYASFTQKNKFKRKFKKGASSNAFVMDCEEILKVLPFFLFGKHYGGRPELFFIASDYPIAVSLCSDGNFHYHAYRENEQEIKEAATKAGFITGDIELCAYHSICHL
ncbi:MAG: hypothetical protein ACOYVG_11295 [Bacteroidota bacterium]